MHSITELPPWERLLKKMVWAQLGQLEGQYILDFGSGEGITADHYAEANRVVAVEPWEEMLANRWEDHTYRQIAGDLSALAEFPDNTFDVVLCHNVVEYVDDQAAVFAQLCRVLKPNGLLSVVKHNRTGRVMQMAVLLDDPIRANQLLDGQNGTASKFGTISYYDDHQISQWAPRLQPLQVFGIRTFWDLQQNQQKHGCEQWQAQMLQLEQRVSQLDPYRQIAFFHHLLYRKAAENEASRR